MRLICDTASTSDRNSHRSSLPRLCPTGQVRHNNRHAQECCEIWISSAGYSTSYRSLSHAQQKRPTGTRVYSSFAQVRFLCALLFATLSMQRRPSLSCTVWYGDCPQHILLPDTLLSDSYTFLKQELCKDFPELAEADIEVRNHNCTRSQLHPQSARPDQCALCWQVHALGANLPGLWPPQHALQPGTYRVQRKAGSPNASGKSVLQYAVLRESGCLTGSPVDARLCAIADT